MIQWWYSEEYLDLVKKANEGTAVWSVVSERHDQLKTAAVDRGDYPCAAFHRDVRNFATARHDMLDTRTMRTCAALMLLHDICEGTVKWDDVFVKHNELMLKAANKDHFEEAAFHRNIKDYAESVYTNQPTEEAPGPGQAGDGGVIRGADTGRA